MMFKFRRATNNDDAGLTPGNAVPMTGDEAPALDPDDDDAEPVAASATETGDRP
jgi:hypothetical protein